MFHRDRGAVGCETPAFAGAQESLNTLKKLLWMERIQLLRFSDTTGD